MEDAGTAVLDSADASEPSGGVEPATSRLVVSLWLSDSVRGRLLAAGGLQIVDDVERLAEAELLAVSTRIPPGESASRAGSSR